MARTPEQAAQAMIENLQKNTGKTLKQWFSVLQKTSFEKHGEYLRFLKTEHDVTHGYANLIAHQYRDSLAGNSKTASDQVDLGINLKGEKPGKRLEASGSFNAMVSHRVRLANARDIDAELKGWLKKAYNAAG